MTPSEIAAAIEDLKPRFLDGLAPPEVKAVLAAAKLRRYMANSVVTNQDHPADHLFLLLTWARSLFLHHARWAKDAAALAATRRDVRHGSNLVKAYTVPRQRRNGEA